MKAVFITGTDTEIGKTIVCGLLARYLLEKGYSVITQKWIQTGSLNFPMDLATHLKLMGKKREDIKEYLSDIIPYTFALAASPHLAAHSEKKKIDPAKIKNSFQVLAEQFDFVLVEGTGGALVPINSKRLLVDIAQELNLPVLIVAQNKLGAINHTVLTIEAIKSRRMKVLGIIINGQPKKENEIILEDNPKIIRALTGEKILGNLPWSKNQNLLYGTFAPIGDNIHAELTGVAAK